MTGPDNTAHSSQVAPISQGRFRFRTGGGRLFQVLWVLCAIAMIPRMGFLDGLVSSLGAAGLIWAIAWTAWLTTEIGVITRTLRATPAWAVAALCVIVVPAIWALDPDGAFPGRSGAILWASLILEWILIVFTPVIAVRRYKLAAHEGDPLGASPSAPTAEEANEPELEGTRR